MPFFIDRNSATNDSFPSALLPTLRSAGARPRDNAEYGIKIKTVRSKDLINKATDNIIAAGNKLVGTWYPPDNESRTAVIPFSLLKTY